MTTKSDVIIIGGGITGLAAAAGLGNQSMIFERQDRPGGLVRSHCFNGGYWFDHVLHLFHCTKPDVLAEIRSTLGDVLKDCSPIAWIETSEGIVRYPFQLNLGSLTISAKINCIRDFSIAHFNKNKNLKSSSYKQFLTDTFGKAMCELFYYPYNEKQWKYPLDKISTNGQLWNLHQPSYEEILEGLFDANKFRETYNTNAFYPQPDIDSPLRGMEVLSNGLAKRVKNLHLNSEIVQIDPQKKAVLVKKDQAISEYNYNEHCLSTIPLPTLIKICKNTPNKLLKEVDKLKWNKVISIGLAIEGPRPIDPGLWRYYTDPGIPFTRLIFMTEFDKHNAPANGWGLLAEIPLPAGQETNPDQLKKSVVNGLHSLNLINDHQKIIGIHLWEANPAYVIFTPESERIVNYAHEYLAKIKITSAGRYGSWEYSSMSKNLEDGFNFSKTLGRYEDC